MRQSVQGLRLLMMLLAAAVAGRLPATAANGEGGVVYLSPDGTRIEIRAPANADTLRVTPVSGGAPTGQPLMGKAEATGTGAAFTPLAPLLGGTSYRVQWETPKGVKAQVDVSRSVADAPAPTVELRPKGNLPANALKVYLHFSQPMEQGVFLDRLRLLKDSGEEVVGPFRETELWSPDGRRLTVWFHPGRQKAGVNLNVDEGPVLVAETSYALIVSGTWRDTAGVALGEAVSFAFAAGQPDHRCPEMEQWKVSTPSPRTRDALRVRFDEALDPAVVQSALTVCKSGESSAVPGVAEVSKDGRSWSFVPASAWEAGDYLLHAEPELEDLAGNSLVKPFEVDVSVPLPKQRPLKLTFTVH